MAYDKYGRLMNYILAASLINIIIFLVGPYVLWVLYNFSIKGENQTSAHKMQLVYAMNALIVKSFVTYITSAVLCFLTSMDNLFYHGCALLSVGIFSACFMCYLRSAYVDWASKIRRHEIEGSSRQK